ncbi:hypothetical protein TSUD_162900 [Trifolium subterraneum]|uniref:Uncharacterized protein n=1 Tax=Trifolium subterraneum TaxID=3900 RepID=A0A2Z6NRG6_TRISU|nr:hypothetical protein TSUD_162900 [Trifolium subterraneum]
MKMKVNPSVKVYNSRWVALQVAANNSEEPPTEKYEEVHGIADSLCFSICNSQTPISTSTNMKKPTDSTPCFLDSLMFSDDDDTKKSHSDDEIPVTFVKSFSFDYSFVYITSVAVKVPPYSPFQWQTSLVTVDTNYIM